MDHRCFTIAVFPPLGMLELYQNGPPKNSEQCKDERNECEEKLMLTNKLSRFLVTAVVTVAVFGSAAPEKAVTPPPNASADVLWNGQTGELTIRYHGTMIFDGRVTVENRNKTKTDIAVNCEQQTAQAEKVEHRVTFSTAEQQEGLTVVVRGTVSGSEEAFPAETPSEAQKRFPYVRNTVGLSCNLRNNAVYDRKWDWVLEGPGDSATRITPKANEKGTRTFFLESRGSRILLLFRPRFYQKHKGFKYYEPWTYKVWKGSVTGYCTWWSYRENFTQKTLETMLDVFQSKHLPDFGYDYMQFDNCYQKGNGSAPWNWLNWDERKYPGRWKHAMKTIRDAGMIPGIWVHRIHRPGDPGVKEIIEKHPEWFVPGPDGKPHRHHGFCSLNVLNKEAVDRMIRDLYRGLAEQGWDYVKIDGTGDLLRAYQDKNCAEFFRNNPTTPEESLRMWDIVAREELGPDVYILACHSVGNARKVIGLVDGGRLSNDGFQPRTLAQYNFMEGVVWRNDADHCDILGTWLMDEDAMMPVFGVEEPVSARTIVRPAICAISGTVLMVSDKAEAYEDDGNIEGMKRSAPVLFTVPGQLYGCGRRTMEWWLQEINRPFDRWNVLARFQWAEKREKEWKFDLKGVSETVVKFADLGLPADREYLVFEFWSQQFLGRVKDSFTVPAMDENTAMQVFAIREARSHPWIIGTTRHLSQGGVSLLDEKWNAEKNILSGKSKVVIDDPYVLTIHLPAGYSLESAEAGDEKVQITQKDKTAAVRFVPSATKKVAWKFVFTKAEAKTETDDAVGWATPPMGWNSYTGYSIAVTEAELLKNIDFLSGHLLPYGYDTVTVDNGWFLSGQGKGIEIALDEYGRPMAHEHFFPHGLKHTIDYAHKRGVKFGIWLLRGINRRAVEENMPVEGTKYRMKDIVDMKSRCPWAVAPWWNYGVDMSKPGAQEYYDGLIQKYADLGVDFIKFDDIVPNPEEVKAVARAIEKCGRDIVLSLSPGDHINVEHSDVYKEADMVRITSDIWDHRGSLETTFRRWEAMQDYTGPEEGSFLDMDMVCFGRLYVTRDDGWECRFTDAQKRTFMVQRALAASPLMLGGVLYRMDPFSLSLFRHADILKCNRNAVIGKLVHRDGKLDVWKTPERGGKDNGWIAVFNRDPKKEMAAELGIKALGLTVGSSYVLRDIRAGTMLPIQEKYTFTIPPDGVTFLRYDKKVEGDSTVKLSAVAPLKQKGPIAVDQNLDQRPLDLGDVVYTSGVGVRAGSELTYDVSNRSGRFEAWAGIDPNTSARRSGRFRVYADGRLVFDSGMINQSAKRGSTQNPTRPVRVVIPLAGVDKLRLAFQCEDKKEADTLYGGWGDAKFVPSSAPEYTVSSYEGKTLAKTPPMGWNSWCRYGTSITEELIKKVADAMVKSGMRDAGYVYVNLDDGWQAPGAKFDKDGYPLWDKKKFPGGMKALGDYLHERGLKFGIYSRAGWVKGHETQFADRFAEWGVDLVKYDFSNKAQQKATLDAIRAAGRDVIFSVCEWGRERPWLWAPGFNAEMWRTTYDVKDKWTSRYDNNGGIGVLRSAHQNEALGPFVGPGRWNDLDMLQVGVDGFDYGHDRRKAGFDITPDEERFQMSLWAVLASPLLAANDVTSMNEQIRSILLNRQVIAVNQDPLGVPGWRVKKLDQVEVWKRPLKNGDVAVVFVNLDDAPRDIDVSWAQLNIKGQRTVFDLWKKQGLGTYDKAMKFEAVPSHGVRFVRLSR